MSASLRSISRPFASQLLRSATARSYTTAGLARSSRPAVSALAGSPAGLQNRWIQSSASLRDPAAEQGPDDPDNVIDPESIRPMHLHPPPAPGDDFNVVMVGAGNIMFGSDEGPWNHSFRFEHKLGPRLKILALIDPSHSRARSALDAKCASFVKSAYENTEIYSTVAEYAKAFRKKNETTEGKIQYPHAFVVGSPPFFRGGMTKGKDLELQVLKEFPDVAMFMEKPVATGSPAQASIAGAKRVADVLESRGNIVSVGYMLRYLRCVQEMKKILNENNLTVMATIARYACAYSAIAKPDWWNSSISMGPVVEQGTHFCDLSRYFGGDVDIDSVMAHIVEFNEAPGKLSAQAETVREDKIAEKDRIPRVTSATWKYESGAVGSFVHAVALQGKDYSCELEVYADGYQLRLVDPYTNPTLYVRRPGDDHEERKAFNDDDPFFSEVSNFVDAIEHGPEPNLLSTYKDAVKTYELTWAIRQAGEKNSRFNKPALE